MRTPPINRVAAGLTAFFLLFALTIDLYWLVNHDRLPELAASNAIARMYRDFAPADRGYYDRAGKLEVGLEALNVCVTPIFYIALLPQFIHPGDSVLAKSLLLAAIHWLEGIVWLTAVSLFVGRMREWIMNGRVRRAIEMTSGGIMIALGLRLAMERTR